VSSGSPLGTFIKEKVMKIQDLRVGNYVGYGHWICKVESVNDRLVISDRTGRLQYVRLSEVSPIEIHKNWLVKLGFEILTDNENYGIRFQTGYFINVWFVKEHLLTVHFYCNHKHIKHIHQLQNLYYSLSEKELELSSWKK